jgi:hypothetical protein
MEITGTLRNARRIAKGNHSHAPCLEGNVFGDTKGRFRDGESITTSTILSEESDIFKTRYSAYKVESWAEEQAPVITFSQKQYNDPIMVPGLGALPAVPPKYNPANDNAPIGGQYIGLTRADFPAVHPAYQQRHGDFMATYTGRQYWPCDPRADEVFIEDIARIASACNAAMLATAFPSTR